MTQSKRGLKREEARKRTEIDWRRLVPPLQNPVSIDKSIVHKDGSAEKSLKEILGEQDKGYAAVESSKDARKLFDALDSRSRMIIWHRFWAEWTLEQVAEKLELSRERVRQLEREALIKMREAAGVLWENNGVLEWDEYVRSKVDSASAMEIEYQHRKHKEFRDAINKHRKKRKA